MSKIMEKRAGIVRLRTFFQKKIWLLCEKAHAWHGLFYKYLLIFVKLSIRTASRKRMNQSGYRSFQDTSIPIPILISLRITIIKVLTDQDAVWKSGQ